MPRRAIDAWLPYLDDVLALWTELGENFKVGDLTRPEAAALRDQLKATLDRLNTLEAEMGLAMGERDRAISNVEAFAVKFRSAVIAKYGTRSPQANRVPKVDIRRSRAKDPGPTPPA